ncbi:hypothetical protein DFQ27_004656 [Actinomortierella ambigua]|uniref:Serine/threonine-protein kinase PLK4 n=1 Tax=Actinomortierella ambigua TaxID=1343610 RepID=A0A9P6Q5B4_9FUNG|nr:hypothetical protein DFQ27_004656 [Actinomortierella ambigua]
MSNLAAFMPATKTQQMYNDSDDSDMDRDMQNSRQQLQQQRELQQQQQQQQERQQLQLQQERQFQQEQQQLQHQEERPQLQQAMQEPQEQQQQQQQLMQETRELLERQQQQQQLKQDTQELLERQGLPLRLQREQDRAKRLQQQQQQQLAQQAASLEMPRRRSDGLVPIKREEVEKVTTEEFEVAVKFEDESLLVPLRQEETLHNPSDRPLQETHMSGHSGEQDHVEALGPLESVHSNVELIIHPNSSAGKKTKRSRSHRSRHSRESGAESGSASDNPSARMTESISSLEGGGGGGSGSRSGRSGRRGSKHRNRSMSRSVSRGGIDVERRGRDPAVSNKAGGGEDTLFSTVPTTMTSSTTLLHKKKPSLTLKREGSGLSLSNSVSSPITTPLATPTMPTAGGEQTPTGGMVGEGSARPLTERSNFAMMSSSVAVTVAGGGISTTQEVQSQLAQASSGSGSGSNGGNAMMQQQDPANMSVSINLRKRQFHDAEDDAYEERLKGRRSVIGRRTGTADTDTEGDSDQENRNKESAKHKLRGQPLITPFLVRLTRALDEESTSSQQSGSGVSVTSPTVASPTATAATAIETTAASAAAAGGGGSGSGGSGGASPKEGVGLLSEAAADPWIDGGLDGTAADDESEESWDEEDAHTVLKSVERQSFTQPRAQSSSSLPSSQSQWVQQRIKMLPQFRDYMLRQRLDVPMTLYKDVNLTADMPFMSGFYQIQQNLLILRLSDGTVQVNFEDHEKLVFSDHGRALIYIKTSKRIFTMSLKGALVGVIFERVSSKSLEGKKGASGASTISIVGGLQQGKAGGGGGGINSSSTAGQSRSAVAVTLAGLDPPSPSPRPSGASPASSQQLRDETQQQEQQQSPILPPPPPPPPSTTTATATSQQQPNPSPSQATPTLDTYRGIVLHPKEHNELIKKLRIAYAALQQLARIRKAKRKQKLATGQQANEEIIITKKKEEAGLAMGFQLTQRVLGRGNYGGVYFAYWHMSRCAAKRVFLASSDRDQKKLQQEIDILKKLKHSHVIQFYGTIEDDGHLYILMEYAENGSLYEMIRGNGLSDWPTKQRIAQEIAKGLVYIHNMKFIHCDLKSGNVLLDTSMVVKICDFGLSAVQDASASQSSGPSQVKGTVRWTAPELFTLHPKYTRKSDVYALGCIMWEIAANKTPPFKDQNDVNIVISCVTKGGREIIPPDTPDEYRQLIERCWAQDPMERPEASEIVHPVEFAEVNDQPGAEYLDLGSSGSGSGAAWSAPSSKNSSEATRPPSSATTATTPLTAASLSDRFETGVGPSATRSATGEATLGDVVISRINEIYARPIDSRDQPHNIVPEHWEAQASRDESPVPENTISQSPTSEDVGQLRSALLDQLKIAGAVPRPSMSPSVTSTAMIPRVDSDDSKETESIGGPAGIIIRAIQPILPHLKFYRRTVVHLFNGSRDATTSYGSSHEAPIKILQRLYHISVQLSTSGVALLADINNFTIEFTSIREMLNKLQSTTAAPASSSSIRGNNTSSAATASPERIEQEERAELVTAQKKLIRHRLSAERLFGDYKIKPEDLRRFVLPKEFIEYDKSNPISEDGFSRTYEGEIAQGSHRGESIHVKYVKEVDSGSTENIIQRTIFLTHLLRSCENVERPRFVVQPNLILLEPITQQTLAGHPLEHSQKVDVAYKIAGALTLVHSFRIVHRDVRASNVVITKHGNEDSTVLIPKLTGFEVCRDIRYDYSLGSVLMRTVWHAPERVSWHGTSFKTDVFSFGVLMYEISMGKPPQMRGSNVTHYDVQGWVTEEYGHISQGYSDLMRRCLEIDYRSRPMMYEVLDELLKIAAKVPGRLLALTGADT